MTVLDPAQWRARMAAHEARAEDLLATYRHPGSKHPVFDFLFNYYPVRPKHLRTWHPGMGTLLADATSAPHSSWRDYRTDGDIVALNLPVFW